MIGNDVVDLDFAKSQSHWKRRGYLDKIFTFNEQEFIFKALHPTEMIWNLWSRKEAVYKIILQKGGVKGYYPIKIECLNTSNTDGIVSFGKQHFFTKTLIYKKLIHSIAVENKAHFSLISEVENSDNLKKVNGIPFFEIQNKRHPASKSHHGNFEKIIWLKTQS